MNGEGKAFEVFVVQASIVNIDNKNKRNQLLYDLKTRTWSTSPTMYLRPNHQKLKKE
jgi:hypothetical protein